MNREQKIDYLERLKAGETSLDELKELEPYGAVIKEGDRWKVKDQLLTEDELKTFLQPYMSSKRLLNGLPIIYGSFLVDYPEDLPDWLRDKPTNYE